MANVQFLCCMRRQLGLPIRVDGVDVHGHYDLAVSLGGGTHARHKSLIAAWRQVFVEAGGQVPDRNIELLLKRTHIPVPADDKRRMDIVVPGLNVEYG